MKIPKKIWLFWDNPNNIPWIVKFNIYKIKKNNSDFDLIIINKKNYKEYVDLSMFNLTEKMFNTPQYFSDLLRIFLLSKYGGVWVDSTLIIWKNLKNLIGNEDELIFFQNKHNSRRGTLALESWFIAAVPNHVFINKIKQILIGLNTYDKIIIFLYFKLEKDKVIKQYNTANKYHLIYHIFNYACQTFPNYIDKIKLHDSDNAYVGHAKFLPNKFYFLNFNIIIFVIGAFILRNYILNGEPENIVVTKLTKGSRDILEKKLMK